MRKMSPFKRMVHAAVILAVCLTMVLGALGVSEAKLTEPDVLASLADKGITPNLSRVSQTAADLHRAVERLCQTRDTAGLERARAAWRSAHLAWCQADPFMFGTAAKLEREIGRWPANGIVIDAAVKSSDLSHMLKNVDTRGYSGAEHLLFTPRDAAAATADKRCAHLLDITGEIEQRTAQLLEEWQADKAQKFKQAGNGKPFLVPGDALSLILARVLNVTEVLLRDRISVPSNFFKKPSRPDTLEAWESLSTRDSFRATVQGLRQAFVGDGSTGMATLVATKDGLYESKDPGLAKEIKKQFRKIDTTLSKLGKKDLDLHARVKKNPATLKKLYNQLNTLQQQIVEAALVLELDVRSGLEVQLSE
ncbi:MAG: imelysin family protein [Desulfobacter sp.]|nr:MAG: imelysin family protein [Desulfobacter sp.]